MTTKTQSYPIRFLTLNDWKQIEQWQAALNALLNNYCKTAQATLALAEKPEAPASLQIRTKTELIALLSEEALTQWTADLMNDTKAHPVYELVAKRIIIQLLQALAFEELAECEKVSTAPNWFYKGSPCLKLEITSQKQRALAIFLNPEEIHQRLNQLRGPALPKQRLDAVTEQTILPLSLNTIESKIKLGALSALKKGDVLKLDQRLSAPLLISLQKRAILQAALGQIQTHKTLQVLGVHHE